MTSGQWRYKMTLWKGKAPSGSVAVGSVGECWTPTLPREFCGRNTSKTREKQDMRKSGGLCQAH